MTEIKDIAIIFSAIILEAAPFLMLGSLIAAIIEIFISSDAIVKMIPKNKILATMAGLGLGFLIPVCDCAVIPVARKLLKKGVGINVGITFMLASPIINPIVLFSTLYAFYDVNMSVFWYRLLGGILVSMTVGIILSLLYKDKKILLDNEEESCKCGHNHFHSHDNHHHEGCNHHHGNSCHHHEESVCHHSNDIENRPSKFKAISDKIISILDHTVREFLGVFVFLILGALIASIVQVLLPQNIWDYFSSNSVLSITILMIFAYLISLCSTSDSFLGKSLLANFSEQSVLAFLILGPMIDVKNTIVLLGSYNKKFVISLISIIFITVFIYVLGGMIL